MAKKASSKPVMTMIEVESRMDTDGTVWSEVLTSGKHSAHDIVKFLASLSSFILLGEVDGRNRQKVFIRYESLADEIRDLMSEKLKEMSGMTAEEAEELAANRTQAEKAKADVKNDKIKEEA